MCLLARMLGEAATTRKLQQAAKEEDRNEASTDDWISSVLDWSSLIDWLIDCRPYSSPLFLYYTIIFLQWQFLVQSLRVRLVIWSLAFSCWVWSLEHDPLESWTRTMRKLDMSLLRRRFWPCGSFGCVRGCINGILWLCLFMKDKTKTNARKTIYSTLTPVKRNETKQTTTKQPQLIIRQYFWRDNKCELLLLKICRRIVENERANVGVFWGLCCCGLIDRCLMNIHSRNSFIHSLLRCACVQSPDIMNYFCVWVEAIPVCSLSLWVFCRLVKLQPSVWVANTIPGFYSCHSMHSFMESFSFFLTLFVCCCCCCRCCTMERKELSSTKWTSLNKLEGSS